MWCGLRSAVVWAAPWSGQRRGLGSAVVWAAPSSGQRRGGTCRWSRLARGASMPRWYFHLGQAGERLIDSEGLEIADRASLHARALEVARALIAEDARSGVLYLDTRLCVADEHGETTVEVSFTDAPGAGGRGSRWRTCVHARANPGMIAAMRFTLDRFDLQAFVAAPRAEDLGPGGDITSEAVIPAGARFAGVMDSRDAIVIAGLPIAEAFFRALDPGVELERLVEDGAKA
eukprot:gene26559-29122_t